MVLVKYSLAASRALASLSSSFGWFWLSTCRSQVTHYRFAIKSVAVKAVTQQQHKWTFKISYEKAALIKNLLSESCSQRQRSGPFPDFCDHYETTWWPFGILQAVRHRRQFGVAGSLAQQVGRIAGGQPCRWSGVAGGERVPPLPLGWYFKAVSKVF